MLKKDKYGGKPLDPQAPLKEAGDLLWYLALYADVTGYVLALSLAQDCYTAPQMRIVEALVIADRPFRSTLARGIGHLDRILNAYGLALADAAQLNIDKLKRRYPEGFTLALVSSHDRHSPARSAAHSGPPEGVGGPLCWG